jgi:exosortase
VTDSNSAPRQPTPAWNVWLLWAVLASLTGAIYAQAIPDLVAEWWNEPAASYGLLVPPLAGYIVYLQKRTIFGIPAQPDLRGLAFVLLACLTFLFGRVAAEFFLVRISFVFLLAALVWTFWGLQRLKALAFPLLLLATSVPLPALVYNSVSAPLQLFASFLATNLAQALGVTVYRDGNIIQLANTTLGVAEACSGLQSLLALAVASLLLGFLMNGGIWRRALLFALSLPLAIAVNIVRVTGTALLADWRPELAEGFYHFFSGWLVFLVGYGGLYLISRLFSRPVQSTK